MATSSHGPLGKLPNQPVDMLVCFAVKEEAKFFSPLREVRVVKGDREQVRMRAFCQVWITGMGRTNAARGIREAIAKVKPDRVITAGFAGGLNPKLKVGDILYDEDFDAGLATQLDELGAISAKFCCHRRVAITAEEKFELWKETSADAVEMESSVIRTICKEFRIPSATIRVISDDAHQDLPLDFNALMTSEDRIDYPKLIWTVLSRPSRIPKLMEFQRQTIAASQKLGGVLQDLLQGERG
ncbi:MAG: nucleoside phosphorylase [Verrucomicrobiales bacterium]|nr:nucleoside phosphorylase [Verrucomicrobiales bacterium]